MAALSALISATNPATFLGSLSYRGWLGLGLCALLSYCNWISTLSRRPKDAPCPEFGRVLRVLYGLFGTRLAEIVLGYFLSDINFIPAAKYAEPLIQLAPVLQGAQDLPDGEDHLRPRVHLIP